MSDQAIAQTGVEAAPAKAGGIKGFFSTTLGKIIAIGGAIGLLAAIVLTVVLLALNTFVSTAGNDVVVPDTTAEGSAAASSSATTVTPAVAEIPNRDVFTPRNPFEPVEAPASAFIDPKAPASSGVSRGTVYLERIIAASGSEPARAVLWYGSTSHTLAQGEAIPDSSWLVYRIRSDSVVMQYGDDYVTLWPGSGVRK